MNKKLNNSMKIKDKNIKLKNKNDPDNQSLNYFKISENFTKFKSCSSIKRKNNNFKIHHDVIKLIYEQLSLSDKLIFDKVTQFELYVK